MGKIIGIVALVLVLFGGAAGCSSYNGLVSSEERVIKSYSQIQNQMQRQAELVPNLNETVKGYANQEKETFTKVAEARAKVDSLSKIDATTLSNNPELQKQVVEAQANLNRNMVASLNAVTEAYPNLKSAPLFANLMNAIEGSQNRITVARKDNLDVVASYNQQVRRMPGKIWASLFGFEVKPQFVAPESAQTAPKVKF